MKGRQTIKYRDMIVFPNAKINIGLYVTEKRGDGFHNLETVFYPVRLADILEINQADTTAKGVCVFKNTGITVDCPAEKNLVLKAYRLLDTVYSLPAVNVHLHKIIPFGAGLGGGSSDAAFMLKALNEYFALGLDEAMLAGYASELGSDCAFFIKNTPAFASGKGDRLEDISLSLNDYKIVLVKPDCGVSTQEAYAGIAPCRAASDLRGLAGIPVRDWRNKVSNDFEKTVFVKYPQIGRIKDKLYNLGAVYASMTGSGSAVFALFDKAKKIPLDFPRCYVWSEEENTCK